MEPAPRHWLPRALRFTNWAQWLALVLAIIPAVYESGGSGASLAASALAGIYVLGSTAIPVESLTRRFVTDGFALAGALMCMAAVTLTGVKDSPFVLLSLIPPIQATLLGGARVGAATGALSGALLIAAQLTQEPVEWVPVVGIALIYLVVAATMIQLTRILGDLSLLAAASEARSLGAERKLESLEQAHELLSRLAQMSGEGTSLPDLGREALDAIAVHPELRGAEAVLHGINGSVVVARWGDRIGGGVETLIPLSVGHRSVGDVRLFLHNEISDGIREEFETTARPLALAFANALLLDEIARQAITRERTRVARDLHDEIGPSLASLGLSLDMAMMTHPAEPALAAHMQSLRENVSSLIDDVRATMSDLRSDAGGTLGRHLQDSVIGLGPGPTLEIAVAERRPPRPTILADLVAIAGEAIRNSHRHSGASKIRVEGWTDFDRGAIAVVDDGSGFYVTDTPPGHYGLVGMKERAARSNLDMEITTSESGTEVSIRWGAS